ncbi:uncharacterized protein LOC108142224 [Drosophila elegans]|uniref:uncharacterized protein LOC108142224 n=1 Tax=Drosophila elegans TaxID=30023 RepID=UPI0007E82802|nr:uncharacterized protein LOC108142224 [Drosophila elegans]
MSFSANLKTILNRLLISEEDRREYTNDALCIQNQVIEKLKNADSTFIKAFDGLSLGGSYLDRVKLGTPDEFDLHLKLKFPFQITPVANEKGFVYLRAANGYEQFVSYCGYISRDKLQSWLRTVFNRVFGAYNYLDVTSSSSDRVYRVKYRLDGQGCAHSIEAKCGNRIIEFDIVPAFEFVESQWPWPLSDLKVSKKERGNYSWLAVPQRKWGSDDNRTFLVCAPQWEREYMKRQDNLKNVLRLMKGLRDKQNPDRPNAGLPHLTSYMIKTVILQELPKINWQEDEGTLLLKMWNCLVNYLDAGQLAFFWADDKNVFDRMRNDQLRICRINSKKVLDKLRDPRIQNSLDDLSNLFDLN